MERDITEGMAVLDSTGRNVGRVEAPTGGYFFLTHDTKIPVG